MGSCTPHNQEDDRLILAFVVRQELEWGSHEKAVTRTARAFGMRLVEVIEACDRAINPPAQSSVPGSIPSA